MAFLQSSLFHPFRSWSIEPIGKGINSGLICKACDLSQLCYLDIVFATCVGHYADTDREACFTHLAHLPYDDPRIFCTCVKSTGIKCAFQCIGIAIGLIGEDDYALIGQSSKTTCTCAEY